MSLSQSKEKLQARTYIDLIGVARVLRLEGGGANEKPVSTYPLLKTENSSDLVHYFVGGAPKLHLKNVMLGRANVRTDRSQMARSFTEGLPINSFTEGLPK